MNAIAQNHHATIALRELIHRIGQIMGERGAHAARTVVLMPYIQLVALAQKLWAEQVPDGFAPRFETSMNWAGSAAHAPGVDDLVFDMGRDLLTARSLLERAGLGQHGELLAGRLVEAACQLASVAAAVLPSQRAAWAAQARTVIASGMDASALALEAAVARIALEWVAASSYAGDLLLEGPHMPSIDLLVVVQGLRDEPMAVALKDRWGGTAVALPLHVQAPRGDIFLHEAADPSDEAHKAAACVLRHIEAGRTPVALAAVDRVLTRRVRAMLEGQGVALRDETGWKLSTTRAAAHLMLAMRACAWDCGSDAVIDWLKHASALPERSVLEIERRVRRAGLRDWRSLKGPDLGEQPGVQELLAQINAWRERLQKSRPLAQWLLAARTLLQESGQWRMLERDAAGADLIAALRLDAASQTEFHDLPQAARMLSLAQFTAWISDTLEAASFMPPKPAHEQVVILPFNQIMGRPFAALVIAGCDESRLQAAPEPTGGWTSTQRAGLGLPSREALEAEVRSGWHHALLTPVCDLLWRRLDASGEPMLPSALVLALRLEGIGQMADDPRDAREVAAVATERPQAVGALLPVARLSATAYEDLRRCPYRFFALRQLGLQEADEIDAELDKRDFGVWLHRVLRRFHQALHESPQPPGAQRARLLDAAAQGVTESMRLDEGEFLPFAAAWPQVREGYLHWLAEHEANEAAVFAQAESAHELELGPVMLVGQIDRIDRLPDGQAMVMDYKTEALSASNKRVKLPNEDTQLAFYAALLHDDTLRAAYVNVGEGGKTNTVEQREVVAARDHLVHGVLDDLRRIGEGAVMAALGEGKACEYCAARGLCRRDFWNE